MTTFTDINGALLDPQPSLSEVFRERLDFAQAVLLNESDHLDKVKQALELITEINLLMLDAQLFKDLDNLNRYCEPTPSILSMVERPRDVFSLLIRLGSPYAFYLFQWVPYHEEAKRYRLKMWHDVKLFNGDVHLNLYPNADAFSAKFKDDEVEFIRLSKAYLPGEDEWKHPRDRVLGDRNYKAPKVL